MRSVADRGRNVTYGVRQVRFVGSSASGDTAEKSGVETARGRSGSVNHLAYLDAGSGSLIVQAVIGGVAGVAVAAKLYWRRLVDRFRRQPTDQR